MILRHTFTPPNNTRMGHLCGPLDAHIRTIEAALDVTIAHRFEQFKIDGPKAKATQALEVLQALYLRALEAPQRPWKDSPALTPQEQAMLELMHRGLSPREIGRSLGLSQGRGQRYLHSAFDKRVHG